MLRIGSGNSDPHVALDDLDPIEELRAQDLVAFDRAIAAAPLHEYVDRTVEIIEFNYKKRLAGSDFFGDQPTTATSHPLAPRSTL